MVNHMATTNGVGDKILNPLKSSKPFGDNIAILVFRNTRSNDSDGNRKSYI